MRVRCLCIVDRDLCTSFRREPWWPCPAADLRPGPRGTRLLGALIRNDQLSSGEQAERDLGRRNHPRRASHRREERTPAGFDEATILQPDDPKLAAFSNSIFAARRKTIRSVIDPSALELKP